MSFGGHQAQSFFGPLNGKTTTFLLEGRDANLGFARAMVGLLARTGEPGAVLDLDAFYSSNADMILPSLPRDLAGSTSVRVPEPGTDIESEVASLFGSTQRLLIVDSLNSLYHLLSLEDGSSRSRKLSFAISGLSYLARTSGKVVVLTMYRREGFTRSGPGKSISTLSDVTASVEVKGDELVFRVERGQAWPGGRFATRTL